MFALIKSLGSRYPIGEIVFARSAFALLPIIVALHASSQWSTLRTSRPLAHLRRSVAGVASLFLSFGAVSLLPLSTATALTYSAPLFITLLSIVLLGEQVTLGRWAAVLIGFVGMLMVIQPDLEAGLPLGKVLGVLAAVATAVALVAIRQMAASESALAIAFYFTLFGTLVGAATPATAGSGSRRRRCLAAGVRGGARRDGAVAAHHGLPAGTGLGARALRIRHAGGRDPGGIHRLGRNAWARRMARDRCHRRRQRRHDGA
ncbi:EamA family transporter [Acidovorax citrulli]|nr:EamA family transporter [Paracidovorax citrulli]